MVFFKFQAKDFIPKIMIDVKDDDYFDEEIEQKIKSEDGFPVPDPGGDNFDPMEFLDEQNDDDIDEMAENNYANHATSSDNLVEIKSEIISDMNNKKSEKRKKVSYSAETKVSFV